MNIFTKILKKIELTKQEKFVYLNFLICIGNLNNTGYLFDDYIKKIENYYNLYDDDNLTNEFKKNHKELLDFEFENDNDNDITEYLINVIQFILFNFKKFNEINIFDMLSLNKLEKDGNENFNKIKNYEKVLNNIVFKEFFNEDFFRMFNFELSDDYKIDFNNIIIKKSDFIYRELKMDKYYKQNVAETSALFDNININTFKKIKEISEKKLKNEQEIFNFCFDIIEYNSLDFKFDLIKRMFLNDDNLLNFKNPQKLITEKNLNNCVGFTCIKTYNDETNSDFILNEIDDNIFDIIDFIDKNKENKYNNTINKILKEYYIKFLYQHRPSKRKIIKYESIHSNYNEKN